MKGVYFKPPGLSKLNFGKAFLFYFLNLFLLSYAKKLLEIITCYKVQKLSNFLLFQPWKSKVIEREGTSSLGINNNSD